MSKNRVLVENPQHKSYDAKNLGTQVKKGLKFVLVKRKCKCICLNGCLMINLGPFWWVCNQAEKFESKLKELPQR